MAPEPPPSLSIYVLLGESNLALDPRDGFMVQGSSKGSHFPGHCAWFQDGQVVTSEPMRPIDFHGEFQKEALLSFTAGWIQQEVEWVAEAFPLPHGLEKVEPGHREKLSPENLV